MSACPFPHSKRDLWLAGAGFALGAWCATVWWGQSKRKACASNDDEASKLGVKLFSTKHWSVFAVQGDDSTRRACRAIPLDVSVKQFSKLEADARKEFWNEVLPMIETALSSQVSVAFTNGDALKSACLDITALSDGAPLVPSSFAE